MPQCSHGIPYECKCNLCVKEALERVRTEVQNPPLEATPEQRHEFYQDCFRRVHPNDK